MGWGTAISAGLQVGSSLFGANQGRKAADAQRKAAEAASNYAKGIYTDAQGNFSPYMQAGQGALAGLAGANAGDYSAFENAPDYLFAKQQGMQGIQGSAAAHGSLYNGGTLKDLASFNSGLATQNFNNWRGSQMGLAQLGAQSAGQLGNIGLGASGQVGRALGAAGDAQAQHYGVNAGLGSALGNIGGQYLPGMFSSSSFGGGSGGSYAPLGSQGSGNNPFMSGNWTMGSGGW